MGFLSDDYRNGVRMMRQECPGRRCVALRGTIGTEVRCGIYDRRPGVCREFAPGSEGCIEARERMARQIAQIEWKPWGYDERPLDGPQPPVAPMWRVARTSVREITAPSAPVQPEDGRC